MNKTDLLQLPDTQDAERRAMGIVYQIGDYLMEKGIMSVDQRQATNDDLIDHVKRNLAVENVRSVMENTCSDCYLSLHNCTCNRLSQNITKEAVLAADDKEDVFCTAKDLKDLVREVEEEETLILNTLLDAVSGSDQRFMEEQGIFLDHRFQHIGAIKILKHLLTERTPR